MQSRKIASAILCVALAGGPMLPLSANATTRTTTFTVTLNIVADCSITATNLAFGSAGLITANIDQTTTLSVLCTPSTAYNVGLDAGSTASSTTAARLLAGPSSSTIGFQLYRDSARTQVWGVTVGTDTQSATATGLAQAITVYGRVPPQAAPAAGAYTSTITATVTF